MNCAIKEIDGDLFSVDNSFSMAHCVAADLKMGKGIAIKFRQDTQKDKHGFFLTKLLIPFSNKFGRIHVLQQQNVKPGGVTVLTDNSRFIYNLVTKQSSWGKPTYQTLHSSLSAMREHMVSLETSSEERLKYLFCVLQLKNNVTKVAMPRIGCGLDGLSWAKVKDLIEEVFDSDVVTIVIYNYSPPKYG